ncbi:PAQR family membrane homeostasis protein TrhA [Ilumatobacter coccineus]|nr:hemolysin III family protein [Ilumatobacter coccineus]
MTSSSEPGDRPVWRGRMHAAAFAVSIPAGIFLVANADRAAARTPAAIYAASLLIMFGMSAAYHRLAKSDGARRWMQRLDHAGIYVLIAGTYVPMTMVAMPSSWGIPVLAVVAGAAVVGVVLKLVAFDRISWLTYALYPAMGWAIVIAGPVLFDSLTGVQFSLVVAGGLLYTMGIPVLVRKRPDPWPTVFGYHEIWHSFVVVAAALHFAAVASLLA